MRPAAEWIRNGGIAGGIVSLTVGAVLGTVWISGMVDRASRVDALEHQLRSRPTVRVTVPSSQPPISPPIPGSPSPRTGQGPRSGQPNPADLAAAVPPAGSGPGPVPPSSTPPARPTPRPTPTPTTTPPTARGCTTAVCLIAAATVKAGAVP